MKFLTSSLVMALALSAPGSGQKRSDSMLVSYVVDGDTLHVQGVGRVRLMGIKAPEFDRRFNDPEPLGKEAHRRLVALVERRWVRLEREREGQDRHRRSAAYVFRDDGLFVNATLLQEGLARLTARESLSRFEELKRAETEARTFKRGIWAQSRPSLERDVSRALEESPSSEARSAQTSQCEAVTRRGARCRRASIQGSRYCSQHKTSGQRSPRSPNSELQMPKRSLRALHSLR